MAMRGLIPQQERLAHVFEIDPSFVLSGERIMTSTHEVTITLPLDVSLDSMQVVIENRKYRISAFGTQSGDVFLVQYLLEGGNPIIIHAKDDAHAPMYDNLQGALRAAKKHAVATALGKKP
jgi:hypothetical protein